MRDWLISLLFVCFLFATPKTLLAEPQVRAPLHTKGYAFLDAKGRRVRLASVNWYGFDQKEFVAGGLDVAPLKTIIEQILAIGVNSVRLPWANETFEKNPTMFDGTTVHATGSFEMTLRGGAQRDTADEDPDYLTILNQPFAAWLDPGTLARGYFRPPEIERIVREHTEGLADHSARIWTLPS